jgi:DNA segregation ATPase FtsK/SpoIIIE-like protein
MYNQVTDRFGFVRTEIVQASPLLGRIISPTDGYSLEVFRSGEHLASVRPSTVAPASTTGRRPGQKPQRMKVADRDVIYWVRVFPQSIPLVGSFTTLDNFVGVYDMTFDLAVSDPVLFAKDYRQGKDPVHLAIERFKTAFLDYAKKAERDKLKILRQPDSVVWNGIIRNNSLSADTGMKITRISQLTFRDDPVRLQMTAMQQNAGKDQLAISLKAENQRLEDHSQRMRDSNRRFHERRELEIQRKFEREEEERQHLYERQELEKQEAFRREEEERQHLHERQELERQSEFEREEKARQHMFDLHYQLRVAAAQELKEILRERIRDTFDRGKPIDDVADESMKLLNAFHDSLRRGYVFSTLLNGSSTSANGISPAADTISSDEDTTTEHEATTGPVNVPPNLSDLSGTKQKEAGKE